MPSRKKPPLGLSVEIETPDGFFPLAATADKTGNRPRGLSGGSIRGEGFAGGGFTVSRQIFRDYADLGLLNNVRFVAENGDIAHEGRIHSMPRTNDPQEEINVSLAGWALYLKSRKIAPLIIDRRLDGWGEASLLRKADLYEGGFILDANQSNNPSPSQPGVLFEFSSLAPTYTDIGESQFYASGEKIGALKGTFKQMIGTGGDASWFTFGGVASDDRQTESELTSNLGDETTPFVIEAGGDRYYAFINTANHGALEGPARNAHAFIDLRVIGNHGLTPRGTEPNEGYYLTDIIQYLLATYYPKIQWAGQDSTFEITQAAWQDSPSDGYDIVQQLNNLILWESNVFEERKLYFHGADLTKFDWQIRTDEAGVTCLFQGDSIENFANGVTVTYNDILTGVKKVLYPSDHSELRDESESNPATRQGEDLWTDVEVPWSSNEGEALQFGRAYLAEYNRPKRPGTYKVTGYIRDGAGHYHPYWKPRCSETIGILDHPSDAPRLITQTDWSEDDRSVTITVDAPSQFLDAVIARMELARVSKNL